MFQAAIALELSSNSIALSMWSREVWMKPVSMSQNRLNVTWGWSSWIRRKLDGGREVLKMPASIFRKPVRRTKPTSGLKSLPISMTPARNRQASVL